MKDVIQEWLIKPWGRLVFPLLLLFGAGASPAPAGVWKFAVACDSRGDGVVTSTAWVNTNVLQGIARAITNDRVEFVVFPGDLIRGNFGSATTSLVYQYAQWSNAFMPVYDARIPVYTLRGNHETYGAAGGDIYLSVFGTTLPTNGPAGEAGLTYGFSHSNALLIGLDQYQSPHRVNQAWLDSQLASNRSTHVFVFGHEPAVQVTHADCLAYENTARDIFLKSITAAGCRIYFCGHDHFYNRGRVTAQNNIDIMQVVLGGGGAPFSTWDGIYGKDYGEENMASNCYYSAYTNGYVLVTVSNFNVQMEWKGSTNLAAWQTYDTFCYQVTNPAVRYGNDYDGDGKGDLAVYDENLAALQVAMSARGYQAQTTGIGGQAAFIAPGDYDGDGIADLALYWSASGGWQINLSDRNYALVTNTLGGTGYEPCPADYDGDGQSDLAVYQKSSGHWQIVFSSNGVSSAGYWGGPGYNPVPGDYDGDARADIVIYHAASGLWQALLSAGQAPGYYQPSAIYYGGSGFLPAPADYDNDGRTDPAVYDKSQSVFFIALSSSNYQTFAATLPATNSRPVINDYDGDRQADLMVYDQSQGTWLGALSADGYQLNTARFGGQAWPPVQNEWRAHLVFLAFGDSITYGGGSSSDSPATAFPKLLETKLQENHTGYFLAINGGHPGETTENGLNRFSRWLDSHNPDLVLLMEGTNDEFYGDPYEQTEDNLRAMVQYALARGKKIIIATIPPVISNQYRDRAEQQARIAGFNPRIYRIAADYNIPVAAVYESITAVPNWQNVLMDQPSANHPNDAGQRVIRDAFYAPVATELDNGEY